MTIKFKKLTLIILILSFYSINIKSQTLETAIKYSLGEQFENAKKAFESLIQVEPANGDYYFYYGDNYVRSYFADTIAVRLNDISEPANKIFKKGTEVDPENPLCYIGLAKIALFNGDAATASAEIEKALSKFPGKVNKTSTLSPEKQALTYNKIVETMIQAGNANIEKALELIQKAYELNAGNPETFLLWGDAFLENNDGSNAIIKYKKAQELAPEAPYAQVRIARLWVRARQWEDAIKYYEEAIKIDPSYAPAYVELGAIYLRANQNEKAKSYFEEYLKLANSVSAKVKYLSVLWDLKDYNQAITIAEEIKKTDPSRNDMNRVMAYCFYELKIYSEAQKFIQEFFANTTSDKILASDYKYYGRTLSKLGNDSLAINEFKKALGIDSGDYDIYTEIGIAYTDLKDYTNAVPWYEKKISLKKAGYSDYYRLGLVYYYMLDWKNSDYTFSFITENKPEYMQGRAFLYRGRCNFNMDSIGTQGLANPYYESYVQYAREDSLKYAGEIIEAYKFFQFYYFKMEEYCTAQGYCEKIIAIDPEGKYSDLQKFKDLATDYGKKCVR